MPSTTPGAIKTPGVIQLHVLFAVRACGNKATVPAIVTSVASNYGGGVGAHIVEKALNALLDRGLIDSVVIGRVRHCTCYLLTQSGQETLKLVEAASQA